MLELHFAPTPNAHKVTIFLEECGLEYQILPLNIASGRQFEDDFLALNPNARMPVLIDHEVSGPPLSVFESGAILVYLGRKTGRFLPADERGFYNVLQWLFWQMANQGPVSGHGNHFISYAKEQDGDNLYAQQRFHREYQRLAAVMNYQLMRAEYLAGDYSVADMAAFPWLAIHRRFDLELADFPALQRWYEALKQRPGLRRGMDVGKLKEGEQYNFKPDEKTRRMLFQQDASLYHGKIPPPST